MEQITLFLRLLNSLVMRKLEILTFCLVFLFQINLSGQFSCGTAVTISDGYTATVTTPGDGGAEDWVTSASTCGSSTSYFTSDDVYLYSFTTGSIAPSNFSMTISSSNTWTGLMLFTSCSSTTISDCIDDASHGSTISPLTVSTSSLSANTTYYVAVGQWGAPDDLNYSVTDVTIDVPCIAPTAVPTLSADCGNGQFYIDVNITDIGQYSS